MVSRAIKKIFLAREQLEGAGARIRRSIGSKEMPSLTPFLMLDHFKSTSLAGFPDHPHRGQETISYILNGSIDHEDFAGNKGTIRTGGLQFMTAGRGIMHSEMPRPSEDGSPNIGLQLWVDLPAHLKSCEPRYRDLQAEEIPNTTFDEGKVNVKVISGVANGVESVKELAYTPVWLLDVLVKPGGRIVQSLPKGWNAFAYVLDGAARFGEEGKGKGKVVEEFHIVVLEKEGDSVVVEVAGDAKEDGHFVIVAGQPLDQDIVKYGPFVMTSEKDVQQALSDFRSYSNGFERARGWESEIGKESR